MRMRLCALILGLALPSVASATIRFGTNYQTIPSVTSAAWMRVHDVDRDGVNDLLVLGSSTSIWWHRGLPAGGYAPAAPLVTFPGVVVLWDLGDINNDGKLDLVAADVTNVAWSLLGNGDGTFQAPRAFLSLFWGACLKLGDLDGDGLLDIVAAQVFGPLYTMRGMGDGRFQLVAIVMPPPVSHVDLAIADFDGDSRADVLALDRNSLAVDFFRGLPDLQLAPPVIVPTPGTPTNVIVADFDKDGFQDAAVLVAATTNVVAFFYGAPVGSPFGRMNLPREGLGTLTVIDLDGDGHSELLATERTLAGDQVVILGRTAPRAYAVLADYPGGIGPQSAVLTDTNADGFRDIVACNPVPSRLMVLHGHGGLKFGDAEELHTVKQAGFDVGDVNGDHVPDIVAGKSGALVAAVHLGVGDGTFQPMITTAGPFGCCAGVAARLADVNQDGRLDLLGSGDGSEKLETLFGDGFGHFTPAGSVTLGIPPNNSLVLADFNGDGNLDAAVPGGGATAVSLGSPSGTFGAPAHLQFSKRFATSADFNGDGLADLIATNSSIDGEFGSQIHVYLGRSDGGMTTLPTFYGGYKPSTIGTADLDHDGIVDLAIGNFGDRNIAFFYGVGDGTFTAGPIIPDMVAFAIEFADLDHDGELDMIATSPESSCVRIWPGQGGGVFDTPVSFGTRSRPREIRVRDLDGDGRLDLVVSHIATSNIEVLMNQTPDQPVPVLVSVVGKVVRAGHVRLTWYSSAPELSVARVERAGPDEWREVGAVRSERANYATFEEDVPDGEYDYRLIVQADGAIERVGSVHVSVRSTPPLAIQACRWEGAAHAFRFALAVPEASPVRLQVFDLSGRVVADDRWTPSEPGELSRAIDGRARAVGGVFWARLSQRDRVVTRRFVAYE